MTQEESVSSMKIRVVLKKNLSVTGTEVNDGLVYHVQNPQSGETFEFEEKEWFLLSSLDAATLAIEIIEEFKLKFNAEAPLEQFKSLLEMATECDLSEDLSSHDNSNENIIRTLTFNRKYRRGKGHEFQCHSIFKYFEGAA